MALFDNGLRLGTIGTGLAIGVGALVLAPVVFPAVAAVVRPIAKAAIKSGLILVEKTRELIAETVESVEDMKAEAQAELAGERLSKTPFQPPVEEM
ncbi:MAG: DUF5132 domain-containing protein [Syntrophobacteraceae bacterium]